MNKLELFPKIIETCGKFIGYVKKNGILITTYSVLLFLVVYSWILNPLDLNSLAQKILEKQEQQHAEEVSKRLYIDEFLPPMLESIRYKYGVDRVAFFEMHNSTKSIKNISYLFFSCIYESYDMNNEKLLEIKDSYQYQRTSDFGDLFNDMREQQLLYINNIRPTDKEYSNILRKIYHNGGRSLIMIPIRDNNNLPIAILVMSSVKETIDVDSVKKDFYKIVNPIKKLYSL